MAQSYTTFHGKWLVKYVNHLLLSLLRAFLEKEGDKSNTYSYYCAFILLLYIYRATRLSF